VPTQVLGQPSCFFLRLQAILVDGEDIHSVFPSLGDIRITPGPVSQRAVDQRTLSLDQRPA
jgi:hypothetical protein